MKTTSDADAGLAWNSKCQSLHRVSMTITVRLYTALNEIFVTKQGRSTEAAFPVIIYIVHTRVLSSPGSPLGRMGGRPADLVVEQSFVPVLEDTADERASDERVQTSGSLLHHRTVFTGLHLTVTTPHHTTHRQ